jgi:hypothetical protein
MRKLILFFTIVLLMVPLALRSAPSKEPTYTLAFYGNNQVWIYDSQRGYALPILDNYAPRFSGRPYDLTWSPDGQFLLMNQPRLALYDWSQAAFKALPDFSYLAELPVSFSWDSQQLMYINEVGHYTINDPPFVHIKKIAIQGETEPENIGTTQFNDMRGGGGKFVSSAQGTYESEQGWYYDGYRFLEDTPFGILYSNTEYGLVFPEVDLGPERINYGVLSPDRMQLAARDIQGSLLIIDLATGQRQTLSPLAVPDLLGWGGDGKIFYSTITQLRDLFDGLTESEKQIMRKMDSNDQDLFLPYNEVTIHELDIVSGADRVVYQTEAFAISRLMPSPDGSQIFFNLIPNLTEWLEVSLQSKITDCCGSYVRPSLYRLDLQTDAIELIGVGFYLPTIYFAD